jgi:hypothetical protein
MSEKNLPKNNPEEIGKVKNIISMSETSGKRGDVNSKIGIGLDAQFAGKERRRHPKAHALLKGLLAYFSAAVLIIGILTVVAWRLCEIREAGRADLFVENYIAEKDMEGWRQQLRLNLPNTYPNYEDASKLAYDVLSPVFELGDITYLRRITPTADGNTAYELFSDGEHFAALVIADNSVGLFSAGEWQAVRLEFDINYFDSVEFPEYRIILPAGASLKVNGADIDASMKEKCSAVYPALSIAENGHDVAPCDVYVFNDIYFLPELSATLEGTSLVCEQMGEGEYFFYYPESAMHSITVTVPVGVDAYVSGIKLTEEWANRTETDGELGALDDGGTGTLPRLSIWTVDKLFGEVEVEAKIGDKDVALLSNQNGIYKFDTPSECKYILTVILPAGAELFVNGKAIAKDQKTAATAEDIAYGFTALGRYEVSELGVIEGAVPNFDKYVLTGYLAEPNVTAKMGGIELPLAGKSVSGYEIRCDFDYTTGDVFDAERIAAAEKFAESYIAYICGGGAWNDPSNEKAFNDNYNALKAQMIEGTAGYVGVMESYRDVNLMPKYDSFIISDKKVVDFVGYTKNSLSCRVEFSVTRMRTVDGAEQIDTLTGSISVLQVLYKGEWRVWSFVYVPMVAE